MAIEIGIELAIAVAALVITVLNVVGLFMEHFKSRERIASLETKVEPFWELLRQNASTLVQAVSKRKSNPHSNPTNPSSEARRKALLDKLENRLLTSSEAKELRQMLQKELADARARGDAAAILVLLLLLGLLAALVIAASQQ